MPSDPITTETVAIELADADICSRLDPERIVVRGVNWTVREGDFWVIGGLQGAGKSDLLSAAAGLARPARGRCRLYGREIGPGYADECLAERLRVALVFGDGGRLFNHLTVRGNVALPLEYHRPLEAVENQARVDALLEATGVAAWAGCMPSDLSVVWRQRVALARALALKPSVLLLDDPHSSLDARHTRWWKEFLRELAAGHPLLEGRPLTVVVAGYDLRAWREPSRQFVLLDGERFQVVETLATADQEDTSLVWRDLLDLQVPSI